MAPALQRLNTYWKLGIASPRQAIEFVLRRAMPFGISFKDLEAYRISTWRHGRLPRVHLTQKFVGSRNVVEIGTCDGNTTLNLAANLPEGGSLTSIDLPTNWDRKFLYDLPNNHWSVADRPGIRIQYQETQYESRIRQALGDSTAVNWMELRPPFDIISVDGCHFRDYLKTYTFYQ